MYNIVDLVKSWANDIGNVNTTDEIIDWISELNQNIEVEINKINLSDSDFWFLNKEKGIIENKTQSFFSIFGLRKIYNDYEKIEQPIIIQNEIGYLGIICKKINGVLNFLMQSKIEPGNVNKIQISPTIQATKSNFTQKHGGNKPNYLDFFINANRYNIIVDQIQSEQSSRFYKKRNRNIIIEIFEDIEILPNYKWMTLGQIKKLMEIDNIVNMDSRTVISCIPFCVNSLGDNELSLIKNYFLDESLFNSIFRYYDNRKLTDIYNYINNNKMFGNSITEFVPLTQLGTWEIYDNEIRCKNNHCFKVIFCDISIEGREVRRWTQPLLQATGFATFGLFMCDDNGTKKFLVRANPEIGCFDDIELGPSVQLEPNSLLENEDSITLLFMNKLKNKSNIKYNVILSEEGGRFYHEQNYNIIIQVDKHEIVDLPKGYFWVDYSTLNTMIQFNNCLNIQLRNLISLLEVNK